MSIGIGTNITLGTRRGVSVSGGLWYLAGGAPTPVAAYQAKGAASLAASYVNLANPGTNNAAPGVAPTWSAATGWTFNGTTQYLTTGVVPNATTTIVVRFANVSNTGFLVNAENASSGMGVAPRRGSGTIVRYFWGTVGAPSVRDTSPVLAAGVLALAGPNCYRDGAADGAITNTWTTIARDFYIGARNNSGTADAFAAGDILAVAIYSAILTAGQVAAVRAAAAAL